MQGFASGFLQTPPRDDALASGSELAPPLPPGDFHPQVIAHAGHTRPSARPSTRADRWFRVRSLFVRWRRPGTAQWDDSIVALLFLGTRISRPSRFPEQGIYRRYTTCSYGRHVARVQIDPSLSPSYEGPARAGAPDGRMRGGLPCVTPPYEGRPPRPAGRVAGATGRGSSSDAVGDLVLHGHTRSTSARRSRHVHA